MANVAGRRRQRSKTPSKAFVVGMSAVICRIAMNRDSRSWKKHSAQKANWLLGRRGEFWQADYWDTFMRDSEHELETRKYIESNPAKAGLVLDPKPWPWSSVRFRDEHG